MTEKLPCPFCGSKDLKVVSDLAEDDDNRIYAYHVHCRDCHATGRNNYPIAWCETEQEAIAAWNDRFIPATIPGGCDRIQLSTTALLHIHHELETIVNIKNHIANLLTPIQMNSNAKSNETVLDEIIEYFRIVPDLNREDASNFVKKLRQEREHG